MASRSSPRASSRLALSILIGGVLLAGCRDKAFPPGSAATDRIVVATGSDVATLDPQNSNDTQSDQAILMIYGGLLRLDDQLRVVPDLAESWSVGADGKTWTFRLRSGLRFDDGTPLDATTVQRSFARALDTVRPNLCRTLFAMIDRVDVIDALTVRFVNRYPFRAFDRTLAHMAASILNPTIIGRYGKQLGRSADAVSGAGPYKLASWQRDQEIVLERNAAYWGRQGRTATISYRAIPESTSRMAALEAGDVDVNSLLLPTDIDRFAGRSDIRVVSTPSIMSRAVLFNCRRWAYTDRRVRQALSHAIDRSAITTSLFRGMASLPTGPLAPGVAGYADLGAISYDPARAKSLLADAGLPQGFKTRLWTSPRFPHGVETAEAVAAQLATVGIQASIEVVDWVTYVTKWRGVKPEDNPMDLFIGGFAASTAEADWSLRPRFLTQPTNQTNYGFYSNAEFDDVIVRAMQEMNESKQRALYRRAQEIVYLEDPAAVWLYNIDFPIGVRQTVRDLTLSPLGLVTLEKSSKIANDPR